MDREEIINKFNNKFDCGSCMDTDLLADFIEIEINKVYKECRNVWLQNTNEEIGKFFDDKTSGAKNEGRKNIN